MTLAEQLEQVQAAITTIETTGQSVTLVGRQWTNADLATLYRRERELKRAITRAARGGIRVRSIVPRY